QGDLCEQKPCCFCPYLETLLVLGVEGRVRRGGDVGGVVGDVLHGVLLVDLGWWVTWWWPRGRPSWRTRRQRPRPWSCLRRAVRGPWRCGQRCWIRQSRGLRTRRVVRSWCPPWGLSRGPLPLAVYLKCISSPRGRQT